MNEFSDSDCDALACGERKFVYLTQIAYMIVGVKFFHHRFDIHSLDVIAGRHYNIESQSSPSCHTLRVAELVLATNPVIDGVVADISSLYRVYQLSILPLSFHLSA